MPHKDPEIRREYNRQYSKKWYLANREKRRKQILEWRENNRDRIRVVTTEYMHVWRKRNPDHGRKLYWGNREAYLEANRNYRLNNLDYWRERWLKWSRTPEGRTCQSRSSARRRAIMATIICTLTDGEWMAILDYFNYRCAYCGQQKVLTQDHIEPISKGGNHTKDNVVPACQSCNSKKRDRSLLEAIRYLYPR